MLKKITNYYYNKHVGIAFKIIFNFLLSTYLFSPFHMFDFSVLTNLQPSCSYIKYYLKCYKFFNNLSVVKK